MKKIVKIPTVEISKAAKADIVRALYDAADQLFTEQSKSAAAPRSATIAFDALQNVVDRARKTGGEEFAQAVETALSKYTEQISAVQVESPPNAKREK